MAEQPKKGSRRKHKAQTVESSAERPEVLEPELAPDLLDDLPDSENFEVESVSDSRDVVPYDPLRAYLREIQRHKPLSKEEELEFAVRFREHKDLEAAYKLITGNLWLVVKIARDYEKAARNLLDLIQEGNIGLMEAVKNFDPFRGVRFPSYALWWIKAYIIRYIIANWRMVKIGTTQAQRKLFFNLRKEKQKLEQQGFYPGPKLLAEKLNVRESDVIEMEQRLAAPDLSVDAPVQEDSEISLGSVLPIDQPTSEDLVAQEQFRTLLNRSLEDFKAQLNPKEKVIFEKRLLADEQEKATLQDLSEQLSLSRERIRQLENRIKLKLKKFLEEKLGSQVESIEL